MTLSTHTIKRAKRRRTNLGMSQRQFAEAIGLPFQTYAQWERGRRDPDAAGVTLLRMAVSDFEMIAALHQKTRRATLD